MASDSNSLKTLKQALGGIVHTDADTCYRYSYDSLKVSIMPEAVICVDRAKQVGTVLHLANRFRKPVTARGAGSSRTAGATPAKNGWVLDLSGLRALEIDTRWGMARAEAGVVTAILQEKAAAAGWFYPPDPSSKKFSTIGGNIACNAGGLRGAKYGVTRDYVVSLKGFLPTGAEVQWGRETRKFAAGFNLRDLWIGSEGMLGIITEACLRLIPMPADRWTALAAFPEEQSALEAVEALSAMHLTPAICEFMDRNAVRGAQLFQGRSVFRGLEGPAILLLEFDSPAAVLRDEKRRVREWAAKRALRFREARSAEAAEALWQLRRSCSPAMFRLADSKLNEDIVVPLPRQVELMRFVRKLEEYSGLPIATFGHVGDGNLHVNIMFQGADLASRRRAWKTAETLMQEVVRLGGAISGEHGIGLAKTPFLEIQHNRDEIQAMRAIKTALDPNNILNPEKMFTLFRVWEHTPEPVTFPWDASG